MTRPRILAFIAHYVPGFNFGGPVRAVHNLTEALGRDVDFRIVTRDRDFRSGVPYPGVERDRWTRVGLAEAMYLSPERTGLARLRDLLLESPHDALYLNSFFSPTFSIAIMALNRGKPSRSPVILAPRGEFAASALAIKPWRKRAFLRVARLSGWYRNVTWHASSDHERDDIRRMWGAASRVHVAPELVRLPPAPPRRRNAGQELRAVFIGRVARVKNLDGALRMMRDVKVPIRYDIYGALEDAAYADECRAIISTLPPNVRVELRGAVDHSRLAAIAAESDVLFLPSHGENFGHAIIEAMGAGCPALISDRTAWKDLGGAGAGWDIPLDQPSRFVAAIEWLHGASADEREALARGAIAFAQRAESADVLAANRSLFESAAPAPR